MLCIACSKLVVFRSGSFCLAISSSCAWLILPTFSRPVSLAPLANWAFCLIRTRAGGVLV